MSEPRHLGNNYCATCQRDVDTRKIIGVQYRWDQPEAYDGISEWVHEKCGRREGRWSHRELAPGEHETRYGGVAQDDCLHCGNVPVGHVCDWPLAVWK